MAQIKTAIRIDSLQLPLQKALRFASKIGASGVELNARDTIRPKELSDTGLRQLRKMLDDLNLKVAAIRFPTRRGYDVTTDLDRRIDATKSAMQLAYRLGCPVVINQIGEVPETEEDPRFSTLSEVIDDLGRFGARVGAFFAAETGTESGDRLASLLDTNEDAFVAAALNPGQLIVNRHNVTEAIKALGHRIQIVSAVDGVLDLAAGRGLSVPLGQGTADFPELLGQLEDFQYPGFFIVGRHEIPREFAEQELSQGVEYLRNI